MLHTPTPPRLSLLAQNHVAGTRPSGAFGVVVTPNQNNIGSATVVQLFASGDLVDDAHELMVNINNLGISSSARNALVEVLYDPAGGTSWRHLCYQDVGPAASYSGAGGSAFRVRRRIPAGSSVGVRGSVNSATLTGFRASGALYGRPSPSHLYRPCELTETLGVVTASSRGTLIALADVGEASEGAWTYIGQGTFRALALEFGMGCHGATLNANCYHVDIGVGASNVSGPSADGDILIMDSPVWTTAVEQLYRSPELTECDVPAGAYYWARMQMGANAKPTADHSISITLMGA